jgi:F-type H+-transporting ATPase subunit b
MKRFSWLVATAATLAGPAIVRAAEEHHEAAAATPTPFAGTIAQSIAAIIVFLVVFFVLKQKAWGPILKGLSDREEKIRRDIEEAEAARARAEATQKEYQAQLATAEQKVRELLAKATADAEQVAATIRTQAQKDAQETKENALRDIDSARRSAVREVHEQAAVLATNVASKILRRNLNPDDQRDLVASSLEQLQTIKG